MSDQNKLAILKAISSDATPGKLERFSFHSLGKTTGLAKRELDEMLTELSKKRLISQYAKKGVDSFTVAINQSGLDAVEDESFI